MNRANLGRAAVVALSVSAVSAVLALSGIEGTLWQSIAQKLMLFPILAAAVWFGWRGGVLTAAIAAACLLLTTHPEAGRISVGEVLVECTVLLAVGFAVGLYAAHEQRRAMEHQRVERELRSAHRELQDNFEGMKRAERLFALGQLSAGLAHEIRNPLGSLSGAAGMLKRSPNATPKQSELLEIIEKECQRLNRLLSNFLDFARPRPPHPRPTSVEAVLDAVIGLASHAVGRRRIRLTKYLERDIPEIECDAEQLQQVLLNMVINSIQASKDGDIVLLTARVSDGRVWMDVRDQGSGVKPEYVDRLFDPFFTTKEHGTGLGLPVAHEIVRSIGGELKVTHNQDRGMTFSVGLSLDPGEHRPAEGKPRDDGAGAMP